MKAIIVGKEYVCYDKRTGEHVEGINLYLTKTPPIAKAQNFTGLITFDEWISIAAKESFDFCKNVPVNSEVELDYEINGKYHNLVGIREI